MITHDLKCHDSDESGFTLLEVLIAITILALMSFLVWQISSGMMRTITRSTGYDDVYHYANILFQRMDTDLHSAYMLGSGFRAGFERSEQAIRETAFLGEDLGERDSLHFASFSHRRMRRNAPESDQTEVGYFVEDDNNQPGEEVIKRREAIFLDGVIKEGGMALPLARRITAFNLTYYDSKNSEWLSSWNSTERDKLNRLPSAVQIEIKFANPREDEEDIAFSTIVGIPLANSPVEF